MTDIEKAAWVSFKEIVDKFLGNKKSENYKSIVANMTENSAKFNQKFLPHLEYIKKQKF